MSEERITVTTQITVVEVHRAPAGVIDHWCEHPGCLRWGSFGFDQGRIKAVWYCGEHHDGPGSY